MKIRVQYKSEQEKESLIQQYGVALLVMQENLFEGDFLTFSDEPSPETIVYVNVPQEEFEGLQQDNILLKAQSKALVERASFTDDVIAEIAIKVYE